MSLGEGPCRTVHSPLGSHLASDFWFLVTVLCVPHPICWTEEPRTPQRPRSPSRFSRPGPVVLRPLPRPPVARCAVPSPTLREVAEVGGRCPDSGRETQKRISSGVRIAS